MSTIHRTDVHRPSAIVPEDYVFVALEYEKCDSMEAVYSIQHNREILKKHREATGATYSRHEHGGNCHICGAHCIYTAIFHHLPTNTYIRTGFDCAEKLDMGDERAFRGFKKSIDDARERMAGKAKAEAILVDMGLSQAWEIYRNAETIVGTYEVNTILDMVRNLVRYGNLSEKQVAFIGKLLHQINNRDAIEAARKAEHEAAANCPTGKTTIRGEVISTKCEDGYYGIQLRMLVKDERGFKVFGSIPASIQSVPLTHREPVDASEVERTRNRGHEVKQDENGDWYYEWSNQRALGRGDMVEFSATCEPSRDDAKFGFYKRPTKARLV